MSRLGVYFPGFRASALGLMWSLGLSLSLCLAGTEVTVSLGGARVSSLLYLCLLAQIGHRY